MDKIAEHMVTSQSEQTRALSAQTLIVFMLDFPMGDKRLHAHMVYSGDHMGRMGFEGRD
jgi:hypothetical protein